MGRLEPQSFPPNRHLVFASLVVKATGLFLLALHRGGLPADLKRGPVRAGRVVVEVSQGLLGVVEVAVAARVVQVAVERVGLDVVASVLITAAFCVTFTARACVPCRAQTSRL